MELSERLGAIAAYVPKCEVLADIGTDHAYIPVYLIKKEIIKKAIAADISKGSIEKARVNAEKYNCISQVDLRCGDGLAVIKENEQPDCIVIAGMGGMLAIEVMKKNISVVCGVKRLIVQPQRDIDKVREFLHEIGMKIIDEKMLIEEQKFYNIIVCEKGEDVSYNEHEYCFGKKNIEKKCPVLIEYIKYELNKMNKVINSFKTEEEHILSRKKELEEKTKAYEEVLLWLQK